MCIYYSLVLQSNHYKMHENNYVSDIAETMEEVTAFFGSKYVKSSFDGIFPRIKQLLEQGRYVLYSGLPCECAGLSAIFWKIL